jgi:hypothetical protein
MDPQRKSIHEQAVLQMLQRTRLSADDLVSHLANAADPAYWVRLNPNLTVGGAGRTPDESPPIDERRHNELVRRLAGEGIFQTDPVLPAPLVARMRGGIEALRAAGWPLAFAFVYDEFWLAACSPSLVRLLANVLGPGYRQIPHVWTHYVPPARGAAGWPPHVDGAGRSNRLSVWIPLSDATLENGCMYAVPRGESASRVAAEFAEHKTIEWEDLRALLCSSRALPARAGSFLGWAFDIIHWGSTCTQPGEPRVSVSLEFIGGNTPPKNDELPLLDPAAGVPPFPRRLHTVGRAILEYEKFEPSLVRYTALAERLVHEYREA